MPIKDPDRRREYAKDYGRIRRARQSGHQTLPAPGSAPLPLEYRLKTAADVLALLGEQIGAVRSDPDVSTLERARCIGGLAAVALRAIESGDMAARLESLESALRSRPVPPSLPHGVSA